MPRITGQLLTEDLGRLVCTKGEQDLLAAQGILGVDYDSAERVMEFRVPSSTRKKRVYVVEVDLASCECACKCEAFSDFREAHKMPYRFEAAAAPLEVLARAKNYRLNPLITRAPRNLCPHARKVRKWLQRHGHMTYFELKETQLIDRASRLTARKSA